MSSPAEQPQPGGGGLVTIKTESGMVTVPASAVMTSAAVTVKAENGVTTTTAQVGHV